MGIILLGLLYAVIAVAGFVLIALLALLAICVWALQTLRSMEFGLPWLKWMALEDVVTLGYHRFPARIALGVLYQNGCMEIRKKGGLDEFDDEWCDLRGFSAATVPFYEFRLTKRSGRRRRNTVKDVWSSLGSWQPAHA